MREFKSPDLKAPRFRPRILEVVNQEFYKEFKLRYPQYQGIPNKELRNKIVLITGAVWNNVVDYRDGVELPSGLGRLFIGTCPRKKGENTNYRLSAQYGKNIQHRNYESDNYTAKIFYTNFESKYRFKFHQLWGFKAVRDFKRSTASKYPENWKQYVVVDPMMQISKLFRKHSYKMKKLKEEEELIKLYNEFDID